MPTPDRSVTRPEIVPMPGAARGARRSGGDVVVVAGPVVDGARDVAATVVDGAVTGVVVGATLVGGADAGGESVVVGAAVVGTAVDVVAGADVVGTAVDVVSGVSGTTGGDVVSEESVDGGAVSGGDDAGAPSSAAMAAVGGSVGGEAPASARLGARTVTAATINADRAWARARAPTHTFIPPYLSAVGPSTRADRKIDPDRNDRDRGQNRPRGRSAPRSIPRPQTLR